MRKRTRITLAGVVVGAALIGGVAWATIPSDTGVYTACKLNATGTIRLIDPSLPSSSLLSRCTSLETQVTWNQKGQKGDTGSTGSAGKDGTNGVNGKDGVNGLPGTDGTNGAPCVPSIPACVGPTGPPGATGKDGTNGANGKDGVNGIPGTNGTNGVACLSSDPACVGPKGDPGTGFTWRGGYLERTVYRAGDVVSFEGSAWITNEDIGSGDIAPPTDPWQLLAAKGADSTGGLSGYEIVTDTVVVKSDQSLTTKTISCPTGKKVLGGGADAGLELDGSRPVQPAENGGLYGWEIDARFPDTTPNGQTVTFPGFAICAVVG
jgi:hypothetical protein